MKKLSPSVLSYIARQISAGRPVNAMLWANEYLDKHSALRRALQIKSTAAISFANRSAAEKAAIRGILAAETPANGRYTRSSAFLYESGAVDAGKNPANLWSSFGERKEKIRPLRRGRVDGQKPTRCCNASRFARRTFPHGKISGSRNATNPPIQSRPVERQRT